MLVEAPLEADDEMPDDPPTEVDELHTSPYIEEAEDDRDDIQMADAEPTHLIQFDDDDLPDSPQDLEDPPTKQDLPSSNNGPRPQGDSAPVPGDENPTEPEPAGDPPTTPDLPNPNSRPNPQHNRVQVPDENPTDPETPGDPPTTPDLPNAGRKREILEVADEDDIATDPEVPDAESGPAGRGGGQGRHGGGNPRAQRAQHPANQQGAGAREPHHRQAGDKRNNMPAGGARQQPQRSNDAAGRDDNRGGRARGQNRGRAEPGRHDGGQRDHPYSQQRDKQNSKRRSEIEKRETLGLGNERMESGVSKVTPTPGSDRSRSGRFQGLIGGWSPPEWLNSRSALLIGVVTVATVTAALLFIGAATTWVDNNRLMSALERATRERAPDTYQGWRNGFETADHAAGTSPGMVRSSLHTLGSVLPLTSPAVLRRELAQKRALYAAMLEYRYEAYGERNATELAQEAYPGESALAAATDTYRLLAEGRHMEAVQRAKKAHHDHQKHRILANAYLAALLETEQAGEILRESKDLQAMVSTPTVYERFLLARAARYKKDTVAQVLFEALVQQHSPGHLDAQIERIHALTDKKSFQEAKTLAQQLLDESEGTASSYQRARLHIALGENYQRMGKHARAEEQFRSAIKAKPTRTSVYLPLTDLFIDDGRLDKARQEVESAQAKAQPSPPLQKRKAHLLFLRGEFEKALSYVDSDEEASAYAPILEGRIRLEQGDYKRAREIFNGIDNSHPRYAAAKSLELYARTQMNVDDPEAVLETLSSLLSDEHNSPLVLRTAARIRLYYAEQTIGTEHVQHRDEAFDLLEQALEAQPERSLNHFLMCEAQLIANDGSDAAMACRKAKRKNPEYLPGMLTVARLYLRRGELTKATSVLDRLSSRFDDNWEIAKLRVRTLLLRHEIGEARSLLDEWVQRPVAEDVEFHLFDGLIAFAKADYSQAVGHFEKAEDDHRYQDEASLYRAHTLARLGNLDKAESIVHGNLTVHPRWRPAAWLIFGEIRRRQGRQDDAMENLGLADKNYEETSGLTPPWRLSHLYKERAFSIRDEEGWSDDRVAEFLDKGKRLGDTESPEIQLGLGLYYLDGPEVDLERAATHLQKVVDLQPYRCQAIQALAETHRQLGNRSGEREMMKLDRENCDG